MVLLATQVGAAAVPRWQKPGVSQRTWQARLPPVELSHTAMPLAGGAGHAVHDVPQELRAVLETHVPVPAGQRWKPGLHVVPHWLVVHTGEALGSTGAAHVVHPVVVPHISVLSSGKHPLVPGQVCVPGPQSGPHAPLTHAVPAPQGVQSTPSRVPQVAEALLLTHTPLHRCQPALQS